MDSLPNQRPRPGVDRPQRQFEFRLRHVERPRTRCGEETDSRQLGAGRHRFHRVRSGTELPSMLRRRVPGSRRKWQKLEKPRLRRTPTKQARYNRDARARSMQNKHRPASGQRCSQPARYLLTPYPTTGFRLSSESGYEDEVAHNRSSRQTSRSQSGNCSLLRATRAAARTSA